MKLFLALLSALLFFSCSLDYGAEVSVKDKVPEFVFTNTHFTRYENSKKSIEFTADAMEQYASDRSSYAKNAKFLTMDSSGNTETSGSCNLISLNTKKEIYTLYDKIILKNHTDNIEIIAENLKWNAKTEQLTSGADEYVELRKDDIEIYGKGFSATGINLAFSFKSDVQGTIIQETEPEQEDDSEDEDE